MLTHPLMKNTDTKSDAPAGCVERLVLGSSSTPITDQRLELLKRGHSNCVPKWEDFAKEMEREMHKWKAECNRQWMHLSQARHNARAIQNIRWGHEGDCGADRLANLIEEDCHRGMIYSENAERMHHHPQENNENTN